MESITKSMNTPLPNPNLSASSPKRINTMFARSGRAYLADGREESPDRSFRFHRIPQAEPTSRPITPSEASYQDNPPPLFEKRGKPYFLLFLTTTFFILVICLSFYIGKTWDSQFAPSLLAFSVEDITQYSPLLEDLPLTYTVTPFNGSLLKPTIFRGDASPEVDAAWEAIGANYRPMAIPSYLAEKSGLKKDQVKINKAYGGGYPANLEGLHHLHCLNVLRQAVYYNFDYYSKKGDGAFKNEPHVVKMHVSHCLDILRQQLMCTVDIGVLGQVWIHPDSPEPYVDFNTEHKCRNFDEIRQWAEDRQLPDGDLLPNDWLEPPKLGDTIFEELP